MARKRFIKPGFFKNEELAALPALTRIFFQGLWCWADREGRLEDRPKRLKSEIMPYDKINIEIALEKLEVAGFITRYTSMVKNREVNCIQIVNFKEHQDVHVNEAASIIPEQQAVTKKKHGADTVLAPTNEGIDTPLNLVLSTLNLEPCLEEEVIKRETEIENAIDDYFKQSEEEKEKSSAKKEKEIPAMNMAIENLEQEHWWVCTLEHYKIQPDERQALFKIFYEQKEPVYKKNYPSWNDMASNFYYWIRKSGHLNQNTSNGNTVIKATTNSNYRKPSDQARNELDDLRERSREFLQKTGTDIHT